MKNTLFSFLFISSLNFGFSQSLVNGSFEDMNGNADLSGWDNLTCGTMVSASGGCPGGGSWHVQANPGSPLTCTPEYVFQKFPNIVSGQQVAFSVWAYVVGPQYAGIGIGKVNNNVVTMYLSATTNSLSWTPLSGSATYSLNPGDTAILCLYTGAVTGFTLNNNSHFDLVTMSVLTGTNEVSAEPGASVYPNPCTGIFSVRTEGTEPVEIRVFNPFGQEVISLCTENKLNE